MMKIICYGLSILLLLSYMVVIGLSFFPNRDKDLRYTSLILDKQALVRENWISILINYKNGVRNDNRLSGWSYPEDNATWAVGKQSDFFFWIDNPQGINDSVLLKIKILGENRYRNSLFVNDFFCNKIDIGERVLEIKVPLNLLKQGNNIFSIRSKDDVKPINEIINTNDNRHLNIMVESVELRYRYK